MDQFDCNGMLKMQERREVRWGNSVLDVGQIFRIAVLGR